MKVTRDDGLYFAGIRANENLKWRKTVEKQGWSEDGWMPSMTLGSKD